MYNQFISDLKKTKHIMDLIINDSVICLYLGGSVSVGTADEDSDYDLVAITSTGSCIDVGEDLFLTYKGKKVHWYYRPISDLFNESADAIWLIGSLNFRNTTAELIIYQKPGYEKMISNLLSIKDQLSLVACYKLFRTKEAMVNRILLTKMLFTSTATKYVYHLCVAAHYLLNRELNLSLLCDLKNIWIRNIQNYNVPIAIDCLKQGLDFIDQHPIDVKKELSYLWETFSNMTGTNIKEN